MHKPNTKSPHTTLRPMTRRSPVLMALEQRFMFDGAAVETALDATKPVADPLLHFVAADTSLPAAVLTARAEAEKLVVDFLAQPDAKDKVFALFNGGQTAPTPEWQAAFDQLIANLSNGGDAVRVELRSGAELQGAKGAFSVAGTTGQFTIYLNADWLAGNLDAGIGAADSASITSVLIEELGHSLDARLNGSIDTQGDEGEHFSRVLLEGVDPSVIDYTLSQNDNGTLQIDGQVVEAEFASFTFSNAYEMVYDQNNSTNTYGVTTNAIDTTERWADKEQNLHYFNSSVSLGQVKINDGSNGINFSGNDISAVTSVTIGGATYYGWVSRPIKANGIVRGFYFWTDTRFTSLALAQQDGNQDGDGSVLNNRGFVLVVDQTWFNSQITATQASESISNLKDGSLGTVWVANVGSSSDRVDSALNALVTTNAAPTATADVAGTTTGSVAAVESGMVWSGSNVAVAGSNATGNVLTNDSDPNGDALTVSKIGTNSASQTTINSGTTSSNGSVVTGLYGTLTIGANGTYTYAVNNTNPTVNALQVGSSLNDVFTYTVSDGKGGSANTTLTIVINGTDDAPVANPDYNTAKESTTTAGSGFTSTGYSAVGTVAAGTTVLVNDTDVDTADTKTIVGTSVSGTATISSVNVTVGTGTLSFIGDSGFSSVGTSGSAKLYVHLASDTAGANYRAVYAADGVTQIYVTSKVESPAGSNNWVITLNANPVKYYDASGLQTISNLASFFTTNGAVGFENSTLTTENTNGMKTATVAVAQSTGYTTISSLSGISGTIAVGMSVTGTGVPAGTTVSSLTYTSGVLTSIRLNAELTSTTGGSFSFTGTSSVGQTIQGAHGTLVLNSDGSYTYTPTADNAYLSAGQSAVEAFNYTMKDSKNVTSTSTLYITVYGAGSSDPILVADQGTAYEAGVGRAANTTLTNDTTAYSGAVATANVLLNDTPGTGGTVTSYSKADGTGTVSAGSTLTGAYGQLSITSLGVYTYTVNDANNTVNALLPGQTVTETFMYKVTNTAGGSAWSKLVITVQGTNDQPVAVADTGAVSEDGTLSSSGNVLSNDTDVDSGDTKTVSKAGTSSANTAVATNSTAVNGLSVTGTYGNLVIGADGTYQYTLRNADANVQALTVGQVVYDTFTYEVKDTYGATNTATLTITVTGSSEPPINLVNGNSFSNTSTLTYSTALNTAIDFTADKTLSVTDVDGNLSSVTLTVGHGLLSFTSAPSGATLSASSGTSITITGTQTDINNALALLRYTPDSGYAGSDFLTISSKDSTNLWDTDGIAINIPTSFNGPTVKESDLSTGSNPSGTEEVKSTTLTAPNGQTFGTATQTGAGTYGTWTFNASTGVITYTLTTAPHVSGTSTTDTVYVTTYDAYGNAISNPVTVTINDDAPVAAADTLSVNSGATGLGNVQSNDTLGADGPKTSGASNIAVVGVAAGSSISSPVSGQVGVQITGVYGVLTLNANGSYTYVAYSNITGSPVDSFVYTIEDADGDQSTQTLSITVVPGNTPTSDLRISKTIVSADSNTIIYQLLVTNDGPSNATGVVVADTLDSNLTLAGSNTDNGSTWNSGPYSNNSWSVGSLANGATATLYIKATVNSGATISSISNTASVSGNELDNDTTDNSDTVTPASLAVTGGNYNESSPRAVFTVTATQGSVLTLTVQDAAEPGKVATGGNEGKPNDSLANAPIYYSLDGGATWHLYSGPITAGSVPVLVAVDITNERDDVYEGEQQLKLRVTSGGLTASGYASIFDDGTGDITQPIDPNTHNNTGANDPTVVKDDDRPKPATPPVVLPPLAPPPAPAEPTPPPPVETPPQVFSSTLQALSPRALAPAEPFAIAEIKTSASGYPIPVNESAPAGLSIYRGVTDQFVQSTLAATKVSLPFDAFIHSNKDAVIKLEAKQADNSPLPSWVQFDPSSGVFEVTPPIGFKGKLDLKVVARDDDGREATAMFQMFVGEQTQVGPQSRSSFSDKLRMAGKRPVTLVRVAEWQPKAHARDGKRTHTG